MKLRIEKTVGATPALFIHQVPEEIEDTVGSAAHDGFEHITVGRSESSDITAVGLRQSGAEDCADPRIKVSGADAELAEIGDSKRRKRAGRDGEVWLLFFKEYSRRQPVSAG